MPKVRTHPIPSGGFARAVVGPPRALPLALSLVAAGYPSPAEDHLEQCLDINDHLVVNRLTTFYWRTKGTSMTRAGIRPGDILVVDRSLEPRDGDVVVATIDADNICKRYRRRSGLVMLVSESEEAAGATRVEIPLGSEVTIWGVVRHCVHSYR